MNTLAERTPADTPWGTPSHDELGALAARNARALMLITVAQRGVSLVSVALLPRLLTVSDLGPLASALAVATLFGIVSDLGMQGATVRCLSQAGETRATGAPIVAAALLLRTGLGILGFVFGMALLLLGPFSPVVRLGGVISLAGLLTPYSSVYGAVLQAQFAVRRLRMVTLLGGLIAVTASLVAAAMHTGPVGVIGAQTAVMTLSSLVILSIGRKHQRAVLAGCRQHMGPLLSLGWKLAASNLFATLYYRLDTLLLTAWSTTAQVGIYFASYRLSEAILVFPTAIVSACFPAITRLQVSSRQRAVDMSVRMIRVLVSAGLVMATVGILNAHLEVTLLYGHRYAAAVPLVQTLFLAVPLMILNLGAYQTAVAFNRTRLLLWGSALGAGVNAVANLAAIPRLGAQGSAVATVVTEVAVTLAVLPWLLRIVNIGAVSVVWRGLATSAVLLSSLTAAHHFDDATLAALSPLLAALAVAASGTMDRQLLRTIWRHRPAVRFHKPRAHPTRDDHAPLSAADG